MAMLHVLVMLHLSAQQEQLDSCAGSGTGDVDDEEAGQSPGGHSREVRSIHTLCCDHISLHKVYIFLL